MDGHESAPVFVIVAVELCMLLDPACCDKLPAISHPDLEARGVVATVEAVVAEVAVEQLPSMVSVKVF